MFKDIILLGSEYFWAILVLVSFIFSFTFLEPKLMLWLWVVYFSL